MRHLMIGLVAGGFLVIAVAGLAEAQPRKPDATLTLSEGSVAAGVGFSWGNGVLTYKGKTHPVQVEGLSVGEVGVTRATAKGGGVAPREARRLCGKLHGTRSWGDGRRRGRPA